MHLAADSTCTDSVAGNHAVVAVDDAVAGVVVAAVAVEWVANVVELLHSVTVAAFGPFAGSSHFLPSWPYCDWEEEAAHS